MLPASVFRAYDIRGIAGEELHAGGTFTLGRALGSSSIRAGQRRVLVARDGRLSSPFLFQALSQGLLASGCEVLDFGLQPTPLLYFAAHRQPGSTAVMLTGSHNPPQYNGFKILLGGEPMSAAALQALRLAMQQGDFVSGQGCLRRESIEDSYVQALCADIRLPRPLKVVIDCANGATSLLAPRLFAALGCSVVPLFCKLDGRFPHHLPDPSRAENLRALIEAVKLHQADMGLAFDGDGDRLGAVTATGEIITAERLLMLFSRELLERRGAASVVFDIKCSHLLPAWIARHGGKARLCKTGRTHLRAAMQQSGALLGGEMSGHLCFAGRWNGFDDALYAGGRLLQLVSHAADSAALLADLPSACDSGEILVPVRDEEKFAIVARLQNQGQFPGAVLSFLDGVRADFPDAFGLVRASNTMPALTLRFAGASENQLQHLQKHFAEQLRPIVPELAPDIF